MCEKNYEKVAKQNEILYCRVGSQLYGTATPESDEDFIGIFMPNDEMVYGLHPCEQISLRTNSTSSGNKNTKDDKDIVYYTLKRFFELAIKNNPNIIELFFVNEKNIIRKSYLWKAIKENYSLFISKRVFDTFLGYANAQEHLMKSKTERYLSLLKAEEYLKNLYDYGIEKLDEAELIELKNITKNYRNKKNQEREYHVKQDIEQIYENIKEEIDRYGHRRQNILKHGFEVKFGSHLVRLLAEGIELAEKGQIDFPLKHADTILGIKEGKYNLDTVLKIVASYKEKLRKLEEKSELRTRPDDKKINKLLIESTKDYLNRSTTPT